MCRCSKPAQSGGIRQIRSWTQQPQSSHARWQYPDRSAAMCLKLTKVNELKTYKNIGLLY